MPSPALREILDRVAAGELTVDEAVLRVDVTATAQLPGAMIDLGRAARCRLGEVIYGEGKSPELVVEIAKRMIGSGQEALVTRVDAAMAESICAAFDQHRYHRDARTVRVSSRPITPLPRYTPDVDSSAASFSGATETMRPAVGSAAAIPHVAVVTAGSTDRPIAAEAIETLDWIGIVVDDIEDVGVAGPQRLLSVVPRLRSASVVVVIAGMEGALASMVGGYVGCPVIAVPTSVGYGSNFAGLTPLLGMLTSCAANVSVVGIDAGFKGGYVAGLIATRLRDAATARPAALV